jgi:hypothetical protein
LPVIISKKIGDIALGGGTEYIRGHIFDAVDYERKIIYKGLLITVFDLKASKDSALYWKYKNIAKEAEHSVSPGFKIKMLNGWVVLTK